MPQQRSLFSFYSRSAAAQGPRPREFFRNAENPTSGPSSIKNFTAEVQLESHSRTSVESQVEGPSSEPTLLERIQQKFARKEKFPEEDCIHGQPTGPRVPGFKRIREAEVVQTDTEVNKKRAKLLEALGADDCSSKGGAWEVAKARFEWMSPSKIRDANGRRPGDPLYDARTLDIPDDVFRKLSASQKQYWATKSQYMDTLLFFKVGTFYELYEIDAEIGHKELDWKLIVSGVGKCRQVGCPQSRIDDAVQKLVSKGYKVGRMEQFETAAQAQARSKGGANVTVQRELTQVLTPSTIMDGNIRPEAVHLLALKEELLEDTCSTPGQQSNKTVAFGFAFVDAAAGRFYVGSISDDCSRSALQTLLTQVAPQELLYEIGGISEETRKALRRSPCPGWLPLVLSPLQPNVEFMSSSEAVQLFRSHQFFRGGFIADETSKEVDPWLTALESVSEKDLVISSLGALVSYLTRIKCDDELLPNGILSPYEIYKGSLRLDGQTVDNLELLQNRTNGGKEATLLSYLDNCATEFGKRLLRRWICHPLQDIEDIEYRLDAVADLRSCPEVATLIRSGMRKLPDLERLAARLLGLAASPMLGLVPNAARKTHERRLKTFFSTILGMKAAFNLLESLKNFLSESQSLKSRLLKIASALADSASLQTCLKKLDRAIDQSSKSPKLVCHDQDTDDNEHDLEVEAVRLSNLIDLFNKQRFDWMKIVDVLGQLDVLISFAAASDETNGATCRPQFVASGSVLDLKGLWHPYAMGGQGGCFVPNDMELGNKSGDVIKPCALLLTGPNMGGKSTLLRATCLAVIMAQLGCFVPCESCTMSPVDTIFTRLGASDHIMTGESTFLVECTEAASVLHYATSNSLVVLDELGRGTSTFDGYAIAFAVFHNLVNTLNCRLIFATHYHPLTNEFTAHPSVRLGHMTCSFLPDSSRPKDDNDSVLDKQLVFLYKLADGVCPKSYGLQVALMAGIPTSVVKSAEKMGDVIQQRISKSFPKNEFVSVEQKQVIRAVLSVVRGIPERTSGKTGASYLKILSLWHELRGPKGPLLRSQ